MSEDTRLPMCPENLHEGMRLGPIHYVVTPERSRAFSHAVKAANPDFIPGPDNPAAIGRIEVSLTRPVLYGDALTSHAKIVSVHSEANRAELQIHVENQRGEQVLMGTAAIRMNDA